MITTTTTNKRNESETLSTLSDLLEAAQPTIGNDCPDQREKICKTGKHMEHNGRLIIGVQQFPG